jgi:hypothetical protein
MSMVEGKNGVARWIRLEAWPQYEAQGWACNLVRFNCGSAFLLVCFAF